MTIPVVGTVTGVGWGFYVRHGHIEPGVAGDVALSALGVRQAEQAAAYLAATGVELVVSSPLRRAVETAEAIGAELGVAVDVDTRLRERINWGDIPGQTFAEFEQLWAATDRDRDRRPFPGAISAREAGERLAELMREVVRGPVVLVGHGGVLQCLHDNLAEAAGSCRTSLHVPHCSITRFDADNTTVVLGGIGAVPGGPVA